ncbi:MAG TPA: hypothetical protein VFX98_14835 [Longimicrobiaceae bacterium]|nr:hypothetical protein [Longimicrobiaceae bacterium]
MATPLTLLMPVNPGTSPATVAATIAQNQAAAYAALTSVGTVHFARFVLLDRSVANLQPASMTEPSDTLVIGVLTEFDGSFDAYIQDFVDQLGSVFDALLANVVGGSAVIPVASNVSAFEAFVAANDVSQTQTGLYQAYTYTVQQILASGG